MKITFLGAARTVTGSNYLCETGKCRFLVDCGMFQGGRAERDMNYDDFAFDVGKIDFVILTHAHIDHSGRIPKLYKEGFRGSIYATKATAELCAIMLPDSGHIQESEVEWEDRKRMRAGINRIEPLYTVQDAIDSLKVFRKQAYGEIVKVSEEISFRFNDAGHILGSSILEVFATEDGKTQKFVFSGDLGNKHSAMLRNPTIITEADCLVIESTYGDRDHDRSVDMFDRFINIIDRTIKRGGNVIIPSFAVGRTQEIIYEINQDKDNIYGRKSVLENVPVYVDSPLATLATDVFRNNLDCFDKEARKYIENGDNPLEFSHLDFTASADESRALNTDMTPKVIISASGMCEAGRIKHHLKHNLWRRDCTILFVGFQAEGTLGRKIVDGAKKVRIFGEEVSVNADIEIIEGFSGHADMDGLLEWMSGFKNLPKTIFITHGEETVMDAFAGTMAAKFGVNPTIPHKAEMFEVVATVPAKSVIAGVITPPARDDLRLRLDVLRSRFNEAFDVRGIETVPDDKLAAVADSIDQLLKQYKDSLKV